MSQPDPQIYQLIQETVHYIFKGQGQDDDTSPMDREKALFELNGNKPEYAFLTSGRKYHHVFLQLKHDFESQQRQKQQQQQGGGTGGSLRGTGFKNQPQQFQQSSQQYPNNQFQMQQQQSINQQYQQQQFPGFPQQQQQLQQPYHNHPPHPQQPPNLNYQQQLQQNNNNNQNNIQNPQQQQQMQYNNNSNQQQQFQRFNQQNNNNNNNVIQGGVPPPLNRLPGININNQQQQQYPPSNGNFQQQQVNTQRMQNIQQPQQPGFQQQQNIQQPQQLKQPPQQHQQQQQQVSNNSDLKQQQQNNNNSNNQQQENAENKNGEQSVKKKKSRWSQVPLAGAQQAQNTGSIMVPSQQFAQIQFQQQQQLKNNGGGGIQQPPPLNQPKILNPMQTLMNIQSMQQQQQLLHQQKIINLTTGLSLEEFSGGLMCEAVKHYKEKMAMAKIPVQPYTPISMGHMLQGIVVKDVSKDIIKAKLDQLEEFLSKEQNQEKQKQEAKEKEKKRDLEIQELAMAGFEVDKIGAGGGLARGRDISKEIDELYGSQPTSAAQSQHYQHSRDRDRERSSRQGHLSREMGVQQDGRTMQTGGDNRGGLGAFQQNQNLTSTDSFANYRKNRSYQYHVHAEERSYRTDRVELCYKCNRPGHIAKDCRFGLT